MSILYEAESQWPLSLPRFPEDATYRQRTTPSDQDAPRPFLVALRMTSSLCLSRCDGVSCVSMESESASNKQVMMGHGLRSSDSFRFYLLHIVKAHAWLMIDNSLSRWIHAPAQVHSIAGLLRHPCMHICFQCFRCFASFALSHRIPQRRWSNNLPSIIRERRNGNGQETAITSRLLWGAIDSHANQVAYAQEQSLPLHSNEARDCMQYNTQSCIRVSMGSIGDKCSPLADAKAKETRQTSLHQQSNIRFISSTWGI